MSEKRRFSRVDINLPVRVYCQGKHINAHVHDISLNGVLVTLPESLDSGEDCLHKTVEVSILSDPERNTLLTLEGHIVRADQQHFAINWGEIELEPLSELRTLLEYNGLGDDVIEREFEHLLEDHQN